MRLPTYIPLTMRGSSPLPDHLLKYGSVKTDSAHPAPRPECSRTPANEASKRSEGICRVSLKAPRWGGLLREARFDAAGSGNSPCRTLKRRKVHMKTEEFPLCKCGGDLVKSASGDWYCPECKRYWPEPPCEVKEEKQNDHR